MQGIGTCQIQPKFLLLSDLKRCSMRKTFTLLVIACLLLGGCSMFGKGKKGPDGGEGQGLAEADLNAEREGRFAGGNIPLAEGEGPFRTIYFDFDSAAINDAARQGIEYNAQVLQANEGVKVQLEGHCDERGTAEYNLALGSQRARAVADALIAYGVPSSRVATISYGEEVPMDPSQSEEAWAKNRRVHFSPYTGTGRSNY